MAMNDVLSDALTRIRNAQHARLPETECIASKLVSGVLNVLKQEGFIEDFEEIDVKSGGRKLKVFLRYDDGNPVIKVIKRVSTPGRRVYSGIEDLPKFHNGLGVSILSTSKGVVSDYTARKQNVGGEILCNVF